jgi:hypothetical protein
MIQNYHPPILFLSSLSQTLVDFANSKLPYIWMIFKAHQQSDWSCTEWYSGSRFAHAKPKAWRATQKIAK